MPDGPDISDPAYLSCFEGFADGYMVVALDYVSSEHYSTCGEEPEPSERDSDCKTKCKPSEPCTPIKYGFAGARHHAPRVETLHTASSTNGRSISQWVDEP